MTHLDTTHVPMSWRRAVCIEVTWLRTEAQVVGLHPFPSPGAAWLVACREGALRSLFRVPASYMLTSVPRHAIRHLYVYHSFTSNPEKAMPSCAPQTSASLRRQPLRATAGLALTPGNQARFLLRTGRSRPTHQPAGPRGPEQGSSCLNRPEGTDSPSSFHKAP